jgi:hypothetical protein
VIEVSRGDVERALGRPVSSYDVEAVDPDLRFHSVTGGVFRVRADGTSLVVKVVRHGHDDDPGGLWVAGADPSHRNYWKREWLAFDSGVLDALPGRLRAPRTLLTTRRSDDECWIWMEDVAGRTGAALRPDDYGAMAYDLGTTQGAFVARPELLPDADWLSRGWLRGWAGACARYVEAMSTEKAWDGEVLRPLRALHPRVQRLWAARDQLLGITEAAPLTLVHCDFWPANVYRTEADETVAIDWSQIGLGAVAQDLDQLTLDTVWMQIRPDESLDLLDDAIVPAYVRGLHDAGCDMSTDDVRQLYAAAAAMRYAWMGSMVATRVGEVGYIAAQEARFGRSFAELVADRARVVQRAVALGEALLSA